MYYLKNLLRKKVKVTDIFVRNDKHARKKNRKNPGHNVKRW